MSRNSLTFHDSSFNLWKIVIFYSPKPAFWHFPDYFRLTKIKREFVHALSISRWSPVDFKSKPGEIGELLRAASRHYWGSTACSTLNKNNVGPCLNNQRRPSPGREFAIPKPFSYGRLYEQRDWSREEINITSFTERSGSLTADTDTQTLTMLVCKHRL